MNVEFNEKDQLTEGFHIVHKKDSSMYVARSKDNNIRIVFYTEAYKGRNYSKVMYYTNETTGKTYKATRYLIKYVSLVQGFSNQLFQKYQQQNKEGK